VDTSEVRWGRAYRRCLTSPDTSFNGEGLPAETLLTNNTSVNETTLMDFPAADPGTLKDWRRSSLQRKGGSVAHMLLLEGPKVGF
jgi:hypothetical protein